MRGVIKTQEYELEYFVYGDGEKILFAFHGFDNLATDFSPLESILGKRYKIVSLNLFFHGSSFANESLIERGMSNDDISDLFNRLSGVFNAEHFDLIGYSIGGRVALRITELLPEKTGRLILLAPDGLKISPFYWFATQYSLGRLLFRKIVRNPGFMINLGTLLRAFRMISDKKYAFALHNFDTELKRRRVYDTWLTLRNVHINKRNFRKQLINHRIKVDLFLGKHDRIIPKSIGKSFRRGLEEQVTVHILETGHRLLKEKNLKEIGLRIC